MTYLREPGSPERQDPYDRHPDSLGGRDHELTLSTVAIFGIFFGLVLLCGIFFGFGYSLGNHKTGGVPVAESAASPGSPNFSGFKPAAGQPAGSHADAAAASGTIPRTAVVASPAATDTASIAEPSHAPESAPVVRAAPVAHPPTSSVPGNAPANGAAPAPVSTAAGLYVQVAAISIAHPGDATLLQNALKAKGYAVSERSGPDNFIHLLIGPFNNRPAAEAMRQRLAGDGYIAYIK